MIFRRKHNGAEVTVRIPERRKDPSSNAEVRVTRMLPLLHSRERKRHVAELIWRHTCLIVSGRRDGRESKQEPPLVWGDRYLLKRRAENALSGLRVETDDPSGPR